MKNESVMNTTCLLLAPSFVLPRHCIYSIAASCLYND